MFEFGPTDAVRLAAGVWVFAVCAPSIGSFGSFSGDDKKSALEADFVEHGDGEGVLIAQVVIEGVADGGGAVAGVGGDGCDGR